MSTDIVQAAVTFLGSKPDVTAAVGADPDNSAPWLFQYKLQTAHFEGSQSTAAVVSHEGGWTGPNLHNTLRFPRLLLSVLGDPERDAGLNAVNPGEVQRRVNAVFEVFDGYLHRPQGEAQMWGLIRTVDCSRLTEPSIYTVGDGIVRLQVYYAVTQG